MRFKHKDFHVNDTKLKMAHPGIMVMILRKGIRAKRFLYEKLHKSLTKGSNFPKKPGGKRPPGDGQKSANETSLVGVEAKILPVLH